MQSTLSRQLPRLHEIRSRCADRVVRTGNLEWRLEAREPDHLRDVQIDLLRYGQTEESLRGRLRAAATAPLAPLMPLDSFPIAIGRRV